MALGIATGQARDGESAAEATALIEGDDGREGFVVIGSNGKALRCFARTPTVKPSRAGRGSFERGRRSTASAAARS